MTMIEYKDFWIRIENRADGLYVRSNSAAGGNAAAPLVLPSGLDLYQLPMLLRNVRGAAGGPSDEAHRDIVLDPDAEDVSVADHAIGSELFHALFPGPVRDAFMRSSGSGRENGLRIRLEIDLSDPKVAELAAIPWELLYNDVTNRALGRSKFTPIVRSLDVAQPYATPPFVPPLRVLLVLANPSDTHGLSLDREKERVQGILQALDGVEVEVIEHATKDKIYDCLDVGTFHVLHYMGHGGFDAARGGVLLLEDDEGRSSPLSARLLGDDLAERRSMRLVFLNACDTGRTSHGGGADPFTGVASALVAAGVPAVVAMQVPIADGAALEFASKFYTQIAHGEPVDAAVAVGRRAIYRTDPGSLEWATPVLFMRSEDGYLFTPSPGDKRKTPPPPDPDPVVPDNRRRDGRDDPRQRGGRSDGRGGARRQDDQRDRGRVHREDRQPVKKGGGIVKKVLWWAAAVVGGIIGIGLLVPEEWVEDDGVYVNDAGVDPIGVYGGGVEGVPVEDAADVQIIEDWLAEVKSDPSVEVLFEEMLYLAEGDSEAFSIQAGPYDAYVAVAVCGGDCGGVNVQLYSASGAPLGSGGLGADGDVFLSTVIVPPSFTGEGYTLEATLTQCAAPECAVGVGTYTSNGADFGDLGF